MLQYYYLIDAEYTVIFWEGLQLISQIAQWEDLKLRASELKRKGFKPGFDHMTAAAAVIWMQIGGQKLCEEILNGRYAPMPAVGWRIAKKNGHYRQLSRLTAIDSIIQAQLLSVLTPVCEKQFSPASFAYRPGKSVSSALEMYCRYGGQYRYAERIDPKDCYGSIRHDVLQHAVKTFIDDQDVCALIMQFARMPLFSDGAIMERTIGLLQGTPISPLLCNIYLHPVDKALEEKGISFIRYADDIVLFADTLQQLEEASAVVKEQFARLGLEINQTKHSVNAPANLEFLNTKFEYGCMDILTIREEGESADAWRTWRRETPRNPRSTIDILSDGILRQKDFALAFESDEAQNSIPIEAVDRINVYSDVIFDSGFLKKAALNGISINLFDEHDRLIGHFQPTEALKAPRLTYEQLNAYYDETKRLELARSIVLVCLHNLRLNIRYHRNQYDEDKGYSSAINRLNDLQKKIKECMDYETLLMLEADVHKTYYGCFEGFLRTDDFRFEKRSRRPPENEINAVLNFGNTVLYNWFAARINRSVLDVRIGYLHATNRRKESLNLDLADIFKPLVIDRVALALINRRALQKKHFTLEENGGVYLTREGKQIVLQALYDKFDERLMIKDKSMNYHEIMSEEVNKLVRHFRGQTKYVAYKQVR